MRLKLLFDKNVMSAGRTRRKENLMRELTGSK